MEVEFGWRTPDFPVDGSSTIAFRDQQFTFLDAVQGHLDSVWVADHFQPWMSTIDQNVDTFECLTTLIYLMAKYPRFSFGTIVMSQSYRQPALVAKMASTLQVLSGGRFVLGLGAGWKEDEYRAYGFDFPAAQVRIRQLEEAVQIIRGMFTNPKTTFRGRYFCVDEAICQPKPSPIPPIMIGGAGRKLTLRVVAKYADWWNANNVSPEEYGEILGVLAGHCREVGRNPDTIVKTYLAECVAITGNSHEAERKATASPFFSPSGALVGTPDEVTALLQSYVNLGVKHFMLRFVDFPRLDGVRLFVDEVLPRFRGA